MRLYTPSGIGYALRPPMGLPYSQRRIRRGVGRLGQSGGLLVMPGPGGIGTQIVSVNADGSYNIVYSASQVAADATLLNQVSSSACTPPLVPTWYPGGQSECAMPGTVTSQIQGAPLDVCDDPSGICEGDTFNGTTITTPGQIPYTGLPSNYTNGSGLVPVAAPVLQGPTPTPNLTPPTTGTSNPVAGSTAGSSTTGITTGTTVNGQPTGNAAATAVCSGLGIGPCIGPLDAGTWGLIAAAGVVLLLMMEKK